ncbi:RimJ/RimL family protein N-acetyltransferase [Novosphingobium chloroacetimidivorans]|uniref:RimJ/RimL family protein N-acetyltransferase n=1 Tax=Novosphingobium chloroacetimidivorans TaxID=1428314 RepID=A0A7W7K995_9SPHN|nr:GNAT family N-acetyltransferase [Novosphingobium chloroacetimidivorans]MBB4857883.1 RimJ/RimL family protein N-acetyltransferase [Novosphingobium chloroacetimidivorans]
MADFRLETERLVLRNWKPGDIDRYAAVANTPEVTRWLGPPLDAAGLAATEARVMACHQHHGHCFWLVQRHDDGGHLAGEVLGFCGIKRDDAPGSPYLGGFEIGWRLRTDAWGRGYAREAATASLDAAFGRFAAGEVIAYTVIENTPSWGLMERLGMRRRPDLDYEDHRFVIPAQLAWTISAESWSARAA